MNVVRRLILVIAGLFGACGVAAAAAGAHVYPDAALTTAAYFLMIGAATLTGTVALGVAHRPDRLSLADLAGALIGLGTFLFSGALAGRVVFEAAILPKAAPAGGMILIAGWLVLGLSAFERSRRIV